MKEVKIMEMKLLNRYPELEICRDDIENALKLIIDTYKKGGSVLICGGQRAYCRRAYEGIFDETSRL